MLDKDAFEAFRETGDLFDRATAARLRVLLESGGSKDGMSLYRAFRGKDPDKVPMLVGRGLMEPPVEEPETDKAAVEPADSLAVEPLAEPLAEPRATGLKTLPNRQLEKRAVAEKHDLQ